jgi:hypothetical protein
MAETTSADYRYWTSNGQLFRARDPRLLDRWLSGAGQWAIADGTHALSQGEQNRLREITPAEAQRRVASPEPICTVHFGGRGEEWREAEDAIRDILFLYWGLTDYNGITGVVETGTFDPWRFLDCTVEEGYGGADTAQLLHQGAAVALLSELMDCRGDWSDRTAPATYRVALEAGRFDHLPAVRAAVTAALDGVDAMYPFLAVVYDDYVLALFDRLSRPQKSQWFRPFG